MAVAIAAVALNIWHPGYCFPKHYQDVAVTGEKAGDRSGSEGEMQV